MPNIAVVNYGGGNTRSVTLALERFGATPILATNQTHIENADGLVFPGQGANDPSMRNLRKSKLVEPILRFVETGKPFLGVCLGLQLLFENSEEGTEPGLGIFKGTVKKLPNNLKIPHMGWNMVNFEKTNKSIFELPNNDYFYFVHSYYVAPSDNSLICGKTEYGLEFCSAVAYKNIFAVQFHPERSGEVGLQIYKNFVSIINR
ncbi:MAG: imidazole glycerol phosphate synthase subunit HisH [SAR202 cluster bacterium]|nr:imidazole glycerol phosphate synthase subunit HisH [SAR202 cluster bacterium]|tara:strand:+ start:1605 stop:2216 length:612 start_codon:yes stop_codon:yes gene_type:complete